MALDFTKLQKKEGEALKKHAVKASKSIRNITIAKTNKNFVTAKEMIEVIKKNINYHTFWLSNIYIFEDKVRWESDCISMDRNGYFHEYETKIASSDYYDDRKLKTEKHALLESNDLMTSEHKPNYFWYLYPANLVPTYAIPSYAGLMTVNEKREFKIIKQAPRLHETKLLDEKLKTKLLKKIYKRFTELFQLTKDLDFDELKKVVGNNKEIIENETEIIID